MPGVPGWKRRFQRQLLAAVHDDRERFLALTAIDADVRRRVYPKVRRSLNRFHLVTNRRPGIVETGAILVGGLVMAFAIFIPLMDWILSRPGAESWMTAMGAALYYVIVFLLPRAADGETDRRKEALSYLSIYPLTIVVFAVGQSTWMQARAPMPPLLLSFLAGGSLIGAFMIALGIIVTPVVYLQYRALRRHMDAVLLRRLLRMLDSVDHRRVDWDDLPFKAHLIRELDVIATVILRDLPNQYRMSDDGFNQWISARARGIAAYFRDLKKWVTMPRHDTREQFIGRLADATMSLADGAWDAIPTAETPVPTPRHCLQQAAQILRGIVVSALPPAALLALNAFGVTIPAAFAQYLYLGAFLWAAIGLVSLLDSLYGAKFEALKNVVQLVPGKK
jgi:hypothetical protein